MKWKPEDYRTEYKDFSRLTEASKKNKNHIAVTLFKEIAALSNTEGGEIYIGIDDKDLVTVDQPKWIADFINVGLNDIIQKFTMGTLLYIPHTNEKPIKIEVHPSKMCIESCKDIGNIHLRDVYVRKGSSSVKGSATDIKNVLREKKEISKKEVDFSRKIPVDRIDRVFLMKKLGEVVNHKFRTGKNVTSELNIFDSIIVSLSAKPEDRLISFMDNQYEQFRLYGLLMNFHIVLSSSFTLQIINIISVRKSKQIVFNAENQELLKIINGDRNLYLKLKEAWYDEFFNCPLLIEYINNYKFESYQRKVGD